MRRGGPESDNLLSLLVRVLNADANNWFVSTHCTASVLPMCVTLYFHTSIFVINRFQFLCDITHGIKLMWFFKVRIHFFIYLTVFLGAEILYDSVFPSVRPSVRTYVGNNASPSKTITLIFCILYPVFLILYFQFSKCLCLELVFLRI